MVIPSGRSFMIPLGVTCRLIPSHEDLSPLAQMPWMLAPKQELGASPLRMATSIGVMDGVTGANPYKTWNEVRSDLPNIPIVVYGPPPTSGTRDAFAEIALSGGCNEIPWIKKLKKKDKKAWKKLCRTVREDGPYVEAGENDNLIIQKLNANKDSFGIFGFSFLDQNKDKVKGAVIDGVEPTFDAIASGDYKVSRSLYFYVKKDHVGVIPGVQEYMEFFMSDDAVGEDGYLLDKGLIPLPASTRTKFQSDAKKLANLVR